MFVPSTHSSTRADLPGIRQTHRRSPTRSPNERPEFTLAWAMDSAKQLPRWELLAGDVPEPEPPSFSVSPRSCVAFQRGVPEFAVLDHLLTGKGLRSALEAQGEHFAAVGREVSEELWERSASQPISPGPPVPFLARPV